MADYNISLGVDVDVSSIQSQIKKTKISPIKVNIDVETPKTDIQNIKKQLAGMNFSNSSISKITKDLNDMNLSVSKVTTNLKKNGNIEISVKGVDKFKRNISLIREYTKKGDLLNGKSISQSFKTEIDEVNDAFSLLKQKQKEISSLEFKLAGLDSKKNADEIKAVSAQIRSLRKEYDKLYSGYDDKLSKSQKSELTKGFQDASNKLKQLKLQTADEIKFKIDTGDFNKDVSNIEEKAKKLGNVSKELKNNITQLKSNKTRMNTALEKGDIDAAIKAYERYLALLKTVNNQLGISSGGQKSIDADFKKLQQLASQIDSINKKLVGLKVDPQANAPLISELTRQLKEAEAAYNSLRSKLQGKLTSGQLEQLAASANAAENEIKELEAKIASLKAEEAAGIKLDIKSGALKGQIDVINQKFKQLGITNQQVTNDITRLQSLLGNMDASDDVETVIADYQTFLQLLEIVGNKVDDLQRQQVEDNRPEMLSAKKEAAFQRLNSLFEEGSRAAEVFGARAAELRRELDSVGNIQGISLVNEKIKNLGIEIKNSHIQTKTIGTRLKEQFAKYGNYLSVASVIMYTGQAIRSMFEQVKLIDSAMTELKKVTNETDDSYNQFLSNAASRAKELGTTIDGLVSSTAAFARLGYSFEQSQGLAEVANVYAVVGDEIDGVEDATQSLVSTLAAFRDEMGSLDESEFAMSIVDKMNEVSNNFAISSGGIGEALQRSASSMAAANNSLDETIALITAANTVVQNPDKVGNAFKTMSMRIRGAKTELEEAGESTDGMAESTASLREEMLALSGVDIMLDNNTFKSTYQIMDELSQKWEGLSDIAQATITELVAGKHQGNVMSSLMSNFDIARDALNTSLNSSGSAMAEHAKWSESLEARLNKLKAAWQSLSQTFMKSDFLKGLIDIATAFINILDKIIDKTGIVKPLLIGLAGKNIFGKISNTSKTIQLVGGLRSIGDVVNILINSFSTLKTAVGAFYTALSSGATKTAAFKTGIASFISGNWITLAIAAIGIVVTLFDHFTESAEELAERVENVTEKYREQHAELTKLKGNYDTSNEESMISRYGELSKGVNELGENIALTADEYAEYQNIVNTIAEQVPSLVAGYDSQGNAILSCKGNVDDLVAAYENLIRVQNESVLNGKNARDIDKNFKNAVEKNNRINAYDDNLDAGSAKILETMLDGQYSTTRIKHLLNQNNGARAEIVKALKDADLDLENGIHWWNGVDEDEKAIEEAIKRYPDKVRHILNDVYSDFEKDTEGKKSQAQAAISNAFDLSDSDFYGMNNSLKNVARQVVNGLDYEFFVALDEQGVSVEDYVNNMLSQLNSLKDSDVSSIETALNLKTQFNGGEISYGEYVQGIRDAGNFISELKVNDEVKNQLQLSLNTEQVEEDYNALKKRLETTGFAKDAEKFLSSLTASEYAVAIDLIVKGGLDLSQFNFDIDSLRAYIESEAKIQDALNFKADISVDTAALETFNTAMSESASAVGLTSESISALESKYKDLEGYDSEKLFEATTNGVKVNREEVTKLEKEYKELTKSKVQKHLDALVEAYNDNVEAIDKCSNASERARLIAENETYKTRIEELAQYQAQLEGVTGAYQRWIDAQNTPENYEGFEAVAKGWETVKDELSRGFLGNASKEYIDLLSAQDLRGADIDTYAAAWGALDDKVTKAGYSIKDFFTLDADGNVTSTGIHRFFESVKTEFEDMYDSTTKAYDFSSENLKIIQEEWGIGIEAIGLILEAAADAGYKIDWGGILDGIDLKTADFETVLEYAEAAQKAFNELENVDDVDFNFKTTNVEDATTQLEKAQSIYKDLITDDNGNINLDASGAKEMRVILAALTLQKQQLERPAIMDIKVSSKQAETDIGKAIKAVQDLQNNLWTLEQYVYNPDINSDDIRTKIGEIITSLQLLEGADPEIYAKLGLSDTEIESLKLAIESIQANISAGIEPKKEDIAVVQSALQGMDAETAVNYLIGNQELPIDQKAKVNYLLGTQEEPLSKNANVNYILGTQEEPNPATSGTGGASGTAFARGNWGINGSGTALGGELGQELVVRDGRFFTIGDNGAEFFNYKPNDIIFNAAQTESLFKYGGIKGANPRGKIFASGSAFAQGKDGKAFVNASATQSIFGASGGIKKKVELALPAHKVKAEETDFSKNGLNTSGKNGGGGDSGKEEFEETIDWIETAIARIEREIDRLDKTVNNTYKSWSERNSSLTSEISKVGDEIALQQKAYDRYIKEANNVGLDESYASKVRDGTIDIEKITNEDLKKKIDDYKQWYEKAIACDDAIQDLKQTESELYAQRFEYVQAQYDAILQGYEHTEAMLDEYISQAEERGHIVSKKYYEALIENEKSNIDELRKEQAELIAERDKAVADGKIVKGSEAWYEQCAAIDDVTQAIEESTTALLEFDNAMREIDWQIFDLIRERIANVTAEADFLIELMSNEKLFDDDGKLTSQGLASMALHGQNYNTHMYQADAYGEEVARLNNEIASDPYNQELINRRNEILELQRESILAAEEEKNSIRDMVEEGINLELDALQERIDKYNESIDAAKDLYDYQKNVKEQSEEIASLEKQRAAYLGDTSEEGRAKLQEVEVSLKEAKENLQETEYERYISDQQALLDTLYNEYELILNQRLDNVDYLLEQVIDSINGMASSDGAIATALGSEGAIAIAVSNNATAVKDTLVSETNKVGTTLSTAMNSIWSTGDGNAKSVLTMYGEDFKTKSTTVITTLNGIKTSVNNMLSSINKDASAKTSANKTSTSAKKNPTTTDTKSSSSSAGDGKPKVGDKVKFVGGQYYYDSQGTKPLGSQNQGKEVYITNVNEKSWATHPYHISTGSKLGQGDLGWLKLNQISGYASGKKNFSSNEIAWTQEGGKQEYIVRPSDGAILTPIARKGSVLNAQASDNLWNMTNSPAEFIRDNLKLGSNVPNNSSAYGNYTQHLDNVVFNFPNVKNYDEMLSAMQKDKNFERLILSMSIDRIAGKSSLAKGKSIR